MASGRVERLTVEEGRFETLAWIWADTDVPVAVVARIEDAVTQSPQGIAADCRPIATVDLGDLERPDASVIVLDRITDPHNIGAIARSAAAAGATGMVVASRRAGPVGATAFKAAAGALERLPVCVVGSVADAVKRLKAAGLWTVGLDAGAASPMFGLELLTEPVAIVVGAEGEGLSPLVARRCDAMAAIPMRDFESLNASVAAALALFEVARVRGSLP
jgi:23S rRNA (guanosine2251-2'-O)-methyltransferase